MQDVPIVSLHSRVRLIHVTNGKQMQRLLKPNLVMCVDMCCLSPNIFLHIIGQKFVVLPGHRPCVNAKVQSFWGKHMKLWKWLWLSFPSVNNTSCHLVEPTQQCHDIPEATTKRAHGEILAHIVVMRYVSAFANCSPFKSHTTKSFFSEHDIMYLPLQAMPRPTTSSAWCWKTIFK